MNNHALECRTQFSALSLIRRSCLFFAIVCGPALPAQLVISATYSVPQSVDGGSRPVFFNLSEQFNQPEASIVHSRLSIEFGKTAALFDDPPYYSDLGLILRKLDQTFSVLSEVTLLGVGSFNDGFPFSSFEGVITFDDDAATTVNSDPDQPRSGLFRPIQPLSLMNGSYSPYWELRLVDAVSESPLLFHSATLTTTVLAAVPEPASIGLAGACVLALVVVRRRRSNLV